MKKVINSLLFFIPIAIVVLAVVLVLNAQFNLTGNVVQENSKTESQARYIYYNTLRVQPNLTYSNTCYPKGEVIPVLPDNKCCDGLTQIGIIDEAQEDCQFVVGVGFCSDCGNDLCDYGENNCNCPEDCNAPA